MKRFAVTAMLITAVLSLTPAAVFAEETAGAETATEAEEKLNPEDLKKLGEKSTETDYQVIIKNLTGKEIKGVAIQVDEEEFGENLLVDDDVFAAEEARVLYQTPAPFEPKEGEEVNPPKYNIRLTFADDTEATIHTFPFGDAETVELWLEGSVAYLKFHSLFLDEDQDTVGNERALQPASYYTDDSGSDYNYSSSSNSGGGGNGGGNNEECLTGGILN